jgi:NADH-quinone oxidoreductase subunit C
MDSGDIRTPVPTIYGDWPTLFGEDWKRQIAALKEKFGEQIEEVRMPGEAATDVPIVYVKKSAILSVLSFVKGEKGFEYGFLSDITATDEEVEPRFEVVYNLYSIENRWRLRLKVRVRDGEGVPTATPLWDGANWAEREVWDMFGIRFEGHPDLRRILMDVRWEGHPLRKDYPLRGYQIFPTTEPIDTDLLK